jgi:hypothetical protein
MKETDNRIFLPYRKARDILKEGDVLMFRGRGIASFFIKGAGSGHYSHVAIASANIFNGRIFWECVEFREWKGGRTVGLERYVGDNPGIIDVYRPSRIYSGLKFIDGSVVEYSMRFNPRAVTDDMRQLTGLPYGWLRIWRFIKYNISALRLLHSLDSITNDDTPTTLVYPVCSTALAYAFSRNGYDLMRNRSDDYMQPSDISRSLFLNYIFTFK